MNSGRMIADRFEISDLEKDLIGSGGMGDVYRGTDTQTGKTVAIKALKSGVVTSDPGIVARFMREGEALRQLNHPNIVKMVAAVEHGGQYYLIIEYVEGGSLWDLLEAHGPLPVTRVVEISLDLADALTRAHRLGIVHRDLKPANVLLAQDGTPRLTDFGMAHVADSPRLTQTGTLIGTIDYLSPEACNGEKLGPRADIWAFGVMLYEMLTGEWPFTGKDLASKLVAILTQPVPDLGLLCPDVPDALADLIYRMLEKDCGQRIPSVRLVGAELEAILSGRTIVFPATRLSPAALPTEDRFATITPATAVPKHNLPVQSIPFVGRETELAGLNRLLADPDVRLVTLLGAGGVGKTRLALEAGAAQMDNFYGVYLISLASLHSVEAIVPAVAEVLRFSFYEGGEPRQQLLDYLWQKKVLFIMDNFEHLLEGAGLVIDILETSPDVKILATSRARLNVQGEQLFHMAGMDLPDWEGTDKVVPSLPEDAAQYGAIRLFLAGARRAKPDFELTAGNLADVAQICCLVQGMPLGILLAAAWVEMLTPAEIADEIGHSLDFLETDLRDVPERQRSIRAVFDYSWHLLPEREREVLQALSVFCGGFTRSAAQKVTGVSLRELMALVNKSLLHRTPVGRCEVHDFLRQYAAEKLDRSAAASETAHDRHSAYYAAFLQQREADLCGARQQAALVEIEVDSENARAAWNWAAERRKVQRLEQAVDSLCRFYAWRGRYQEGEVACRGAASRLALAKDLPAMASGEGQRVLVKILARQSAFCRVLERAELASQLLQQSLALLEKADSAGQDIRREKAYVLLQIGHVRLDSDLEGARRSYEQSLVLYRTLGDRWDAANALDSLSRVAQSLGSYDKARQMGKESLEIRRALGDRKGIASSLAGLSYIALSQGQLEEGERLRRESITIRQDIGDRAGIASGLLNLGGILFSLGKFAEAHSLLGESVAVYNDLGFRDGLARANNVLGLAKMHLGKYEQARAQGQRDLCLAREIDNLWGIGHSFALLGRVALAEEAYPEARRLLQESTTVYRTIGERDEWVKAFVFQGVAARGLGQPSESGQYLLESLQAAVETRAFGSLIQVLPLITLLLADQGDEEWAVELYALALCQPAVANSRWFQDVAGRHMTAVADTLPPDIVMAAKERGEARDVQATVAELLVELGGYQHYKPYPARLIACAPGGLQPSTVRTT